MNTQIPVKNQKKNRRRSSKSNKSKGSAQVSPPLLLNSSKFWFLRLYKWGNRFRAIVAVVVSAIGAIGTIVDAKRPPEFYVQAGKIDSPFEMRFTLKNPSHIFDAKDITFLCTPNLEAGVRNFFNNMGMVESYLAPLTIEPGGIRQYTCPMSAFGFRQGINKTATTISINYKTLFFHRHAKSEVFTWDNMTKQWAEGALVN